MHAVENLDDWPAFERRINALRVEQPRNDGFHSSLLFRGQADSDWELETSLERAGFKNKQLADYYRIVKEIKPKLEALSGRTWPDIDESDLERGASPLPLEPPPASEYLVHLRHHGFPSPLLDWTSSEYVAAFFAFRYPIPTGVERVSIFAYREYCGEGKQSSSDSARIFTVGPNLRTHSRHFLQQAEYTFCARYAKQESTWYLEDHPAAFAGVDADLNQDRLYQFTLPSRLRGQVLDALERYNINAFSLFQTEDALAEALSSKYFRELG